MGVESYLGKVEGRPCGSGLLQKNSAPGSAGADSAAVFRLCSLRFLLLFVPLAPQYPCRDSLFPAVEVYSNGLPACRVDIIIVNVALTDV